ncbi:TonB-linked SusC/RagA family outer membrane protein [Flavobacterium araucananum]|uniref:SusC/RagA family TonB-linked outer membrane protein n=1 Tax=Flavobacterium araucananum TaxID=946678 RepID=A0A227P3G9_9FLAO|nr:TonB-dependent receptor [Flavobacterium araucananum]OXG03934.1 SusC/RagA family TonB-linked outer membrane protein [Flavobacterium araucananum]PWJ98439.1 TonB-linked SusC/RagA family outer membrane protein [Flavobacterium araucananum]
MKHRFIGLCMVLLCSVATFGQITVKGTVKDKGNVPIPGVNLMVKGTTTNGATDFDGNFTISVPNKNAQIEFSFIGFANKTVPVGDKTVFDVTMEESSQALDEIVVVGYAAVKKSDVTSSISSIKGKELQTMTVGNVAESLQGKVAGVQVTGQGGPGAQPRVLIRGISTINLSTDPLYVIDGIPMGTSINFLSNNEIESMEVLKDASASAIYGSRASNGVILITTKKGKAGKTRFNFDMSSGIQMMNNPYNMANAENYATIMNKAYNNSGYADYLPNPSQYNGKTTDWWKAGIKSGAPVTNASLGVSGGSDKHTYSISLNYYNSESIYEVGGWKRITMRINNDFKFSDKFSAGVTLNPRYETYGSPNNWADFDRIDPITPIYKPADQLTGLENEYSIYARSPSYVWNPVAAVKRYDDFTDQYNLNTNGYLQYQPIKGLVFRTQASIEVGDKTQSIFRPDFIIDAAHEKAEINSVERTNTTNVDWTWQNTATYTRTFAGKHNASLMIGNTMEEYNGNDVWGYGEGVPNNTDAMREVNAATKNRNSKGNSWSSSLMSYISRFSYNYDNKYYFTGTFRRDGSSKFMTNNKWANFPSASVSWRVLNERFMESAKDVLSDLRFRAGWGKVGNQNLPAAVYQSNIGQGFYPIAGNIVDTSFPSSMANKDIKWETVEDISFGLDFGLWKNKLSGSLEYYQKKTNDMLFKKQFPTYSGFPGYSTIWTNVGSMQSSGIDLLVSYKDKKGNFTYGVDVTFTTVNVEMLSLSSEGERLYGAGNRTLTVKGEEPGYFYGYVADGLFQNQTQLNAHTDEHGTKLQPYAQVGDIRFKDVNGDGKLDDKDRTKIGSPWADYNVGLNLTLAYKQFDLVANFYSSIGNDIVNQNISDLYNGASLTNKVNGLDQMAWHGEGTSNYVPRLSKDDNNENFTKFSSFYVQDGSFVRMKNLQVGFSFYNKFGLDKLRISLSGQNLWTWTKYTGVDPEVAGGDPKQDDGVKGSGFGGWNYPVQPTILMGLNVAF